MHFYIFLNILYFNCQVFNYICSTFDLAYIECFARVNKVQYYQPLSLFFFVHNSRFSDYLHLFYPNELEVKVTTDTQKSASYLDLTLKSTTWNTKKKLYDKRDDFTFPTVNFPFIISNLPASLAYGVYNSQLIR